MDNNYRNDRPLGYQQILDLTASTALTVPAGAIYAIVTPETSAVRWRDDGVAPTAGIGYPLPVGAELELSSQLTIIRFIESSGGATLSVCYYGFPL